jgi:hypothetical protein
MAYADDALEYLANNFVCRSPQGTWEWGFVRNSEGKWTMSPTQNAMIERSRALYPDWVAIALETLPNEGWISEHPEVQQREPRRPWHIFGGVNPFQRGESQS